MEDLNLMPKLKHIPPLNAASIIQAFEACFGNTEKTKLIGGFDEPFYQAKTPNHTYAEIQFCYDYPRSALHEVSHWCIAGAERRKLNDFGYWYRPDGRSLEEQKEFFIVEGKPQAYEWVFCEAAGIEFEVSLDNLDLDLSLLVKEQQEFIESVRAYKEFILKDRKQIQVIKFSEVLSEFRNQQLVF